MPDIVIRDVPDKWLAIVRGVLAAEARRDTEFFRKTAPHYRDPAHKANAEGRAAVMETVAQQLVEDETQTPR